MGLEKKICQFSCGGGVTAGAGTGGSPVSPGEVTYKTDHCYQGSVRISFYDGRDVIGIDGGGVPASLKAYF